MGAFNAFRILGDLTHLLSKVVLVWSIHSNRSAEGVSLITQVLYAVVFCTRYLDLVRPLAYSRRMFSVWNLVFKITYISSSLYIVYVMLRVFARSRERERAWKFGAACLGGSLVLAPFAMMALSGDWGFFAFFWTFSEILESVCVLPQLMLLRQTNIPTVIDSFYLVLLGSYRCFYVANWIWRGVTGDHPDKISVIFGTVQVLFYIDFAWVYWTRQRVKLRNGTVVDQDDMSRGYLVGKFLGGRTSTDGAEDGDLDADADPEAGGNARGWAGRGISISADEQITGHRPLPRRFDDQAASREERTSIMKGEQQEELDFEDDEAQPEQQEEQQAAKPSHSSGVTGGEEWRGEDSHK